MAGAALPRNTVLKGDVIAVMRELPSESVDFILIDPPYLVNYRDRRRGRGLAPAFAETLRVLNDNCFYVSFYGWQAADRFV